MAKTYLVRAVMALTFICCLGFGSHAGAGMKERKMQGKCSMSAQKGCQGLQQLKGLNDKEMEQVKSEMKAFKKDIEPIKQEKFEKKMELISVLAKKDADVVKARELQSEISDLKNQIAQKKISCLIRMKKISSVAGRFFLKKCFMKDQGMGGSSCPGKKGATKPKPN